MQLYTLIHFKSVSYPLGQGEESSCVNYRSQRGESFPIQE